MGWRWNRENRLKSVAMEQVFLHGEIRDRIQDLMKSHKVTQAELAARIGCSESINDLEAEIQNELAELEALLNG